MATASAIITRTVTLVLAQKEADWLRAVTQNPLPAVGKEPDDEKAIRQAIFVALNHTPTLAA